LTTPLIGWNYRKTNLGNWRLTSAKTICNCRWFEKCACRTGITHAVESECCNYISLIHFPEEENLHIVVLYEFRKVGVDYKQKYVQ
jgi:hypothetical protein